MVKCTNTVCGHENPDGFKFCELCGSLLPQKTVCAICGAELLPSQRFCPQCGAAVKKIPSAAEPVKVGMGDKNVIAGDVIGKKDDYHIQGSATFVTNEDDTKKVVICSVCGRHLLMAESYTCPSCGNIVCASCYSKDAGLCSSCVAESKKIAEEQFTMALQKVYEDGHKDAAESRQLSMLQKKLGVSAERAAELEKRFRTEIDSADSLTQIEKISLQKAESLFMSGGDCSGSWKTVQDIIKEHPENEEVISVYLELAQAIAPDVARDYIKSAAERVTAGGADYLTVHLSAVDIALRDGDLKNAEKQIDAVEKMWPGYRMTVCYKAAYLAALAEQTGSRTYIDQARQLMEQTDETDGSKRERSRVVYTKLLVNAALNPQKSPVDVDALCLQKDIFPRLIRKLTGHIYVAKNGSGEYTSINEALAAACSGSVLEIGAGVYNETVVLDKKVTLRGVPDMSGSLPLLSGNGSGAALAVNVSAQIEHIAFRGNTAGEGLVVVGCSPSIIACDFSGNSSICLYCKDGAEPEIKSCTISNGCKNGIVVENAKGTFTDCTVSSCAGPQIVIDHGSSAQFSGCTVRLGKHKGVIVDSASAVFESCTFSSNEIVGIESRNDAVVKLTACKAEGNGQADNAHDGGSITKDGCSGF